MTVELIAPERLSEILRRSTDLADRALDALITQREVSADQTVALAKAARLLQDLGVEWPPLLTHVMYELADKDDRSSSDLSAPNGLPDVDLHGLTRFFAGFRKDKDQR